MSNRVANVLGSYDFFGKSIPGIVFIIGLSILLPSLPLGVFGNSEGVSFAIITALALILVFSGLVVGQAVHTLADNVEKIMYRVGKFALNEYYLGFSDRFLTWLEWRFPRISAFVDWVGRRINSAVDWLEENTPRLYRVLYFFYPGRWVDRLSEYIHSKPWFERRYWGIHDSFKSHRRLFENELGWYFDLRKQKRTSDLPNISFDHFRDCFEREFGIDVARFDESTTEGVDLNGYREFRQLYPMIASEVANSDTTRAEGFQARYSFCRGMWVVLFLLMSAYIAVLWSPFTLAALNYTPVVMAKTSGQELGLIIWGMLGFILLFIDASGDYKQNYIEYLVNDFCTVVRNREKTLSPDRDDEQEQEQQESNPPYYN